MARQCGQLLFEGSVGNLTGYQVNGRFYLRKKGGVSRRRICYDKRFENTRRNAEYFAKAQKIASAIYGEIRHLRSNSRLSANDYQLTWYALRNRAQELVRKAFPLEEIKVLLRKEFVEPVKELQATSCKLQASSMINDAIMESPGTDSKSSQFATHSSKLNSEIFLGNQPNAGLIPGLIDQLAAGTALLKAQLLQKKINRSVFGEQRKQLDFVLRQFRR